jgi:hypothetical protein
VPVARALALPIALAVAVTDPPAAVAVGNAVALKVSLAYFVPVREASSAGWLPE